MWWDISVKIAEPRVVRLCIASGGFSGAQGAHTAYNLHTRTHTHTHTHTHTYTHTHTHTHTYTHIYTPFGRAAFDNVS